MRRLLLSILLTLLVAAPSAENFAGSQRPIPPGLHEGEKRINAPLDPPVFSPGKNIDLARLNDEAAELARLSAAIPAQVNQVNRGQIPKDLAERLKRIEKLAKHLRSEINP